MFTLFFEILTLDPWKVLKLVSLALLIKLKYRFYAPTRKAYQEIHFFFDKLSRFMNIRGLYNVIYETISLLSNDVEGRVNNFDICY